MVERLRETDAFVPDLSMVAVVDDMVVGYILLTKIKIGEAESLALAPVAVLPEFHNQGIGSKLIEAAHKKAIELGFTSIVLLGNKDYYPRFGYVTADSFGITLPFDVPSEYVMVKELIPNSLAGVSGVVEYHPTFFL